MRQENEINVRSLFQIGQCTEKPVETNYRELFNRKRWHSVCG